MNQVIQNNPIRRPETTPPPNRNGFSPINDHGLRQRPRFTLTTGPFSIELGRETKIMGVINATPDSFSQDGCYGPDKRTDETLERAHQMVRDGADIIDIGGESTRPGARPVSAREEMSRTIPLIKALAKSIDKPVSIDTYKPEVAKAALDAGACIINNIMGTEPEPRLIKLAKNYGAGMVLMHIQGAPETMQQNIHYNRLMDDITRSLGNSVEKCLEYGIKSDKIILDPGIGFGKTVEHNLEILNRLGDLSGLGRPLLIGTSRKSFIGKILDRGVSERLAGTIATVTTGIISGAHIVRVHDVKQVRDAVKMTDAIINVNTDH